jgi:uncharacterized protein (DUF697 family)
MNQTALLHIVERLEGFLGRLPERIRRPVLSELVPLKELFLQQRSPRFLFVGSSRMPMSQLVTAIFALEKSDEITLTATPVHRWTEWKIDNHGSISILDARDADAVARGEIERELKRESADVVFVIDEGKTDFGKLPEETKVVGICVGDDERAKGLEETLRREKLMRDRVIKVVRFIEKQSSEMQRLMSVLAQELPNEAKIEMIRISRDREAQHHVAQTLVKSTTAICTAIGAQPIPLADMPILTTLQLVMTSGIMYVSGRERSLRAATEFMAALGANVGVGMLLREGARAILKFFPGWGNVICGMVAGAGTYAIGRAATAFFIEGVSLKDARRTYLRSRKKRPQRALPG